MSIFQAKTSKEPQRAGHTEPIEMTDAPEQMQANKEKESGKTAILEQPEKYEKPERTVIEENQTIDYRTAARKMRSRALRNLLIKIGIIVAALYIVFHFILTFRVMHDNRMFPTLRDGEFVLYNRIMDPVAEHIVLYTGQDGQEHVGRIIAVPGETVEIREAQGVFVNGSLIYSSNPYATPPGEAAYPITVEEEEYFILCDFRESMEDSRTYGLIQKEDIIGVAIFTMRHRGL